MAIPLKSVLKVGEPIIVIQWQTDEKHLYDLINQDVEEGSPAFTIREGEIIKVYTEGKTRAQIHFSRKMGAFMFVAACRTALEDAISFLREFVREFPRTFKSGLTFAQMTGGYYTGGLSAKVSPMPLMNLLSKNPVLLHKVNFDYTRPFPAYLEPEPPKKVTPATKRYMKVVAAVGEVPPRILPDSVVQYPVIESRRYRLITKRLRKSKISFQGQVLEGFPNPIVQMHSLQIEC